MGLLWSLLFGRRITVNEESYQVVRKIGEGGEGEILRCMCLLVLLETGHYKWPVSKSKSTSMYKYFFHQTA